jgi:hypothetical protein
MKAIVIFLLLLWRIVSIMISIKKQIKEDADED